MPESLQVFGVTDRRALERNVLKPIVEDENFRKKSVLERIQQEDFETSEFRELYTSIQIAALTGKDFDRSSAAYFETISQGIGLNGSWSAGVERLKNHRFDCLGYPLSDLGNAERFGDMHGSDARYDHTRGQWLLWDGRRWKYDEVGESVELMSSTLRGMYADAESLPTETERKAAAKWALASESRARISDALTVAQSHKRIRSVSTDFDRDPWLLNVQNGILDLKGGTFLPHDHRMLCSKIAGVSYNEQAESSWWDSFLRVIFNGDEEMIGFLRRAVGYSLTGTTDSQALFFAYGSGANGKTTFFETLRLLFGDYFQKAPSELLLLKRSEAVPADVARLRGVRLVILSEVERGRRLNESKLKDLTGSDTVTARHLYGEWFEFQSSHKLWMFGNHKPVVTGTDHGLWRRLHLIPFTVTIPENEQKPMSDLLIKASKEMSGILNWCLEGLEDWKRKGLAVPDAVKTATEGYREESDTVQQFLSESCGTAGEVSSNALYEAYQAWVGNGAMSSRVFMETLKAKGYLMRVGAYKKRIWQGISLSVEGVEHA